MMKNTLLVICGAVIAALALHSGALQSSEQQKIATYYAQEAATLESAHSVRKRIQKGVADFVLVDVRSAEEYREGHIIGAVNVPAYSDRDNSSQTDQERIVEQFQELQGQYADKTIILYCYSASCMSGRKIGNLLAEHEIFVKELTVGWNEWRYFWQQWNYPHEWDSTRVDDYIAAGEEPGIFEGAADAEPVPCSVESEFGC